MAILVTKLLHKAFLNDLLVFSFVVSTGEIDLFGDRLVPEIFQSLRVGVHFASLDSVLSNHRRFLHESVHVSDALNKLILRQDRSIHLLYFVSHSAKVLIHVLVDQLRR